ncbi:MAG: hypothetical protein ACI8RZ_000148 [Myxococcota bacterium]|jgi:hypothetical protein
MMSLLACVKSAPELPEPPPVVEPTPIPEPVAAPKPPEPPEPVFSGTIEPIPEDMRAAMTGVTWREGCPVGLDELRLLRLSHWDFDGNATTGELIVAGEHAEALVGVFAALFEAQFAIRRMKPTYHYGGSDDASMADDNTSAFNCRAVTGGGGFSQHSYGHAIDINTIENPYVRGKKVLPPAGAAFLDRGDVRPGMIAVDGPVVVAFVAVGWKWGGNWSSLKDYQHFSVNGR